MRKKIICKKKTNTKTNKEIISNPNSGLPILFIKSQSVYDQISITQNISLDFF